MKNVFIKFSKNEKFNLLVLAGISCAVMLPIFFRGLPYGIDMAHHFQCAYSYYEGFLDGDFYPSWSANRNLGFGGMELRLYPPLSHYLLAVIYLFIRDWHLAFWLTVTLFSFIGSLGVYLWSRELMTEKKAMFAGCFYALMPYHLNQIYSTFFFSEFVGSAVLPFSFWLIYRVAKRGKLIDVVGLAISFAVLILSHLPLAVIGSICFLIYGLSLLEQKKWHLQFLKLTTGALLGLAASSFFLIKIFQERNLLGKTLVYADPWYNYKLHFLISQSQVYTESIASKVYANGIWLYELIFYCTVGIVVFCAIPFVIYTRGNYEKKIKGIWLIFGISLFLTLSPSDFIWKNLELLQEVQFPWRWLTIISLMAAVVSAAKLDILIEWFKCKKRPLSLIITGAFIVITTIGCCQIINKALFIPKDITEITVKSVQSAKGLPFWWTIWAKEDLFRNTSEKVSIDSRTFQVKEWTATKRELQVSSGESETVHIATFYHPNWKATVNDAPAEVQPDENGAILISIPAQSSIVKLYFQETFIEQTGKWVSVFTWLCLTFISAMSLISLKLFQFNDRKLNAFLS